MATFDQRHQIVGYQNNSTGRINFATGTLSAADLVKTLHALQAQVLMAQDAGDLDPAGLCLPYRSLCSRSSRAPKWARFTSEVSA